MALFHGSKQAVHLQARFILHMCIEDTSALRDCIHAAHITLTHGETLVIESIFSEIPLFILQYMQYVSCLYFCGISVYDILTKTLSTCVREGFEQAQNNSGLKTWI